jgi:hypothetical protein
MLVEALRYSVREGGRLLWRMVKLNHELVDSATQESAHVWQQPRHPEEVVTGLQQSHHILNTIYQLCGASSEEHKINLL